MTTLVRLPPPGSGPRLGLPELTLETGWRSDDHATRVKAHVDLALALAQELAHP